MNALEVKGIEVSFEQKNVLKGIDWAIKKGEIATLIGPNGCGKSTLLKTIVGTLKPTKGTMFVDGEPLHTYGSRPLAQKLAFLPQVREVPKDMTVEELVYCGRYPYQDWWRNTAAEDRKAVDSALEATKTTHLKEQMVSSLSGGERQRVWIAMALAQEPQILILDEPTTYLDINHQFEVMELLQRLNQSRGLTVVMVLHELNQAAQYSHRLGVIKEGHMIADGAPKEVLTEDLLRHVFSVETSLEELDCGAPYIKIKGIL